MKALLHRYECANFSLNSTQRKNLRQKVGHISDKIMLIGERCLVFNNLITNHDPDRRCYKSLS